MFSQALWARNPGASQGHVGRRFGVGWADVSSAPHVGSDPPSSSLVWVLAGFPTLRVVGPRAPVRSRRASRGSRRLLARGPPQHGDSLHQRQRDGASAGKVKPSVCYSQTSQTFCGFLEKGSREMETPLPEMMACVHPEMGLLGTRTREGLLRNHLLLLIMNSLLIYYNGQIRPSLPRQQAAPKISLDLNI